MNIPEIFGSMVFNDKAMKKYLSPDIYAALKRTVSDGKRLDIHLANDIAKGMKDWAVSLGATHYSHWFQPMTGITAEKHDSFISPDGSDGVIMEFSGKELVKGESDASSFPTGGLRATFEARGYTAWDPTSYAFVKEDVLYIPTAFCSYGGHSLDQKTPLLRSMECLNKQAVRILKLFGQDYTTIKPTVGAEQEYFLIDKNLYNKRKDLIYTGRTLFGARAPKGQEMDDHYFGTIKPRVAQFMREVDEELWKLGVLVKTEHNEVAPSQHELAPIFSTTNIACDHNQLIMEVMQKIAGKHGLVCLLHEKPFESVNGSGKHNNWSISTPDGRNLLEPGETPYQNAQFLLFLCAVIKAVDEYQDLLRISVASAGNDHRLGANEAPPAIISMFLGDEISGILDAIENDSDYEGIEKEQMKVGVHVLPKFPKDTTDRNRTSPFAFTGNKFEFRMPGSSSSIARANTVINTAVAQSLKSYADRLENAENFEDALHKLIKKTIKDHKRIVFNGNGYDDEWIAQAEKRGLLNLRTTPECLPYLLKEKNIELFESNKVFTREELEARYEVYLDNYVKTLNIEALTMVNTVSKDILPAISEFTSHLCKNFSQQLNLMPDLVGSYEKTTAQKLSDISETVWSLGTEIKAAMVELRTLETNYKKAMMFVDKIIPAMNSLREQVDNAEVLTAREYWPLPTYGEILYSV